MPTIRQKWIERDDLRANPDLIYVFGDNVLRRGMGGQAAAMRGEPNAVGVATKWSPGGANAYFTDEDYTEATQIIARDMRSLFAARDAGKIIIIPLDGLGTGLAQLSKRAPETNRFLEWMLELLTEGGHPPWKQILNR